MIKNNLKMSEELEKMAAAVADQLRNAQGNVMVDSEEDEEEFNPIGKLFASNVDPAMLEKVLGNGTRT